MAKKVKKLTLLYFKKKGVSLYFIKNSFPFYFKKNWLGGAFYQFWGGGYTIFLNKILREPLKFTQKKMFYNGLYHFPNSTYRFYRPISVFSLFLPENKTPTRRPTITVCMVWTVNVLCVSYKFPLPLPTKALLLFISTCWA